MTRYFPYRDQKIMPVVTEEEIAAFDMARFQFAKDVPYQAVLGQVETVREASLQLLESAMGENRAELRSHAKPVRSIGGDEDVVW